MMQTFFEWFAHTPQAITWVSLLILAFFACFLFRFRHQAEQAKEHARNLTRFIHALPSSLNANSEIDTTGLIDSPIKRRFEQFRLCLIRAEGTGSYELRSTRSAVEFFDPDAVLRESINFRFYQSVPNILVGLGLFFTFLGLTAALTYAAAGATSTNITQVQASLNSLLDAASFKFISSLVALACSLLFLAYERAAVRSYQGTLESLMFLVDRSFPTITAEALLNLQLSPSHLMRHSTALVEASAAAIECAFDRSLGSAAIQFQLYLQNVEDLLNENKQQNAALKEFSTTLAISVSKAIDETLSPTLLGALSSLETTVSSLGSNMQTANADILQRMVDEFGSTLEKRTQESFDQMIQAAGGFAFILKEESTELKNSFGTITSLASELREQGQAGLQVVRDATASFQSVVAQLLEASTHLTSTSEPLAAAALAVQGLLDGLYSIQETSAGLLDKMQRLVSSMEGSLRTTATSSQNIAESFKSEIEAAFNGYKDGFGQIDAELAAGFNVMTQGIEHTIEQVRVFITESDAGVAKAVQGIEGAVSGLESQLAELDETLAKFIPAVGASLSGTNGTARTASE